MFENIIHAFAHPAFVIGCKWKIEPGFLKWFTGWLYTNIQPDILISIGISMAQHNINIVKLNRIRYFKLNTGLKTGLPGMTGNSNILFKYIDLNTGEKKQTGYYDWNDSFQGESFLQK